MIRMNGNDADVLLKGAKRLDQVVLSQVFDTFFASIYSYITFRIGDPQVSAQLAGQIFVDLLGSLSKRGEPTRNLIGWLYQTADSLVQDYLHTAVFEMSPAEAAFELTSDTSPEDKITTGIMHYRLQAIFQTLSPAYQHFLALRFGSQRSIEEIGQILSKSPQTVKELQFEALKALQQALHARVR